MPVSLKKEFEKRIYMYPLDALYIKKIAQEISLPLGEEYKLFSLMGGQELADTLPLSRYQNFKLESKTNFRFNLHQYSSYSKGTLKVKDILKQANFIAKKNATEQSELPPFTLAISDFKTIQATKEILDLIINHPLYYKNLRIVLASEFNTVWQEKEDIKPIEFELIYYGFNPFDKSLRDYLNTYEQQVKNVDDLFDLQRQSEFGFLGISHPQTINIADFLTPEFIVDCERKRINAGYNAMNRFLIAMKDKGMRALEINYQFKNQAFQQAQEMLFEEKNTHQNDVTYSWLKFFNEFADNYGMLKTGGFSDIK